MAIQITYKLAMAAGRDAANKAMKASGRSSWSEKDWGVATTTFNHLMDLERIDAS